MAGNKNSGRRNERPFADALQLEIKNAKDQKALRRIARTLLSKAESGNMQAMSLLMEKLDGKIPQAIEQDVQITVERIERVFVDPPARTIEHDPEPNQHENGTKTVN